MGKKKNIWITPHQRGWAVKREGGYRSSRVERRKAQAVSVGREMARRDGVELIIQRRDGSIQSKHSY